MPNPWNNANNGIYLTRLLEERKETGGIEHPECLSKWTMKEALKNGAKIVKNKMEKLRKNSQCMLKYWGTIKWVIEKSVRETNKEYISKDRPS